MLGAAVVVTRPRRQKNRYATGDDSTCYCFSQIFYLRQNSEVILYEFLNTSIRQRFTYFYTVW